MCREVKAVCAIVEQLDAIAARDATNEGDVRCIAEMFAESDVECRLLMCARCLVTRRREDRALPVFTEGRSDACTCLQSIAEGESGAAMRD